jgi:SAM-dependent methyltransferase
MKPKYRESIIRILHALGLIDYAIYLRDAHYRDFHIDRYLDYLKYWRKGAQDGLPIPPMYFIYLVIGNNSVERFFETGYNQVYKLIIPLLERKQFAMQQFKTILDFGCGCGRIMRYWKYLKEVELWGIDYNPRLIQWSRRNLPFARYKVNSLYPPIQFNTDYFDFIYARSIFTHLYEDLQNAWISELYRVMRPGGVFLFTVSGDQFKHLLTENEIERYQGGEMVLRSPEFSGKNRCATFHPPAYVLKTWPKYGFEIIDSVPGGKIPDAVQDTYLARKGN